MANVFDVARYILNHAGGMPTTKLQKLAYYCQAWSLAWDGVPLFEEDFQAWANSPICPELYATYKGRFWLDSDFYDPQKSYSFTPEQIKTINTVLEGYGDKELPWLNELVKKERPWWETRRGVKTGADCDSIIPKELMQRYYRERGLEDVA